MLKEEVELYTKLTGEDRLHAPIMKIGAYLDGYNKGLEVLDKVRAEIDQKQYDFMADKDYDEGIRFGLMLAYQIIDKYTESEVQDANSN